MSEYLLTHEPWLPVVTPEGTDTVGLIEAFTRADSLMVAPGGPLEDRAVHRLLLAISYAALGAPTPQEYPRPFDGPKVAQWLRAHEDSFDLLHPTAPFAQDAALAQELKHAHVVPIANMDSTIARSRPLLTDHRRVTDVPSMTLAAAALALLVYNAFDAPGIHEGVKAPGGTANCSLKGTEGSTLAFLPKGTLATSMRWSMIPVELLGKASWTYSGPGAREATPETELQALTWHYRRLLLHHDGTHATGVQVHQGWSKKLLPKKSPTDTLPGQRNYVLSTSDPKTTAATGEIGQPTTAGRGNPLHLVERWEAGSPTSLSGQVRAAVATHPDLTPPRIVVVGQRLENTSLKVLTREAEVPRTNGGHTAAATKIREARLKLRLPSSADHQAVSLLDTPEADITAALLQLKATPEPEGSPWPTNARALSAASTATEAPELEGLPPELAQALAAVMEIEARQDAKPDGPGTLRSIRYILRTNPALAEHLAHVVTTRIPTVQDTEPLHPKPLPPHQRLWAGLLAAAIHQWRSAYDGDKPLPTALRQAGARLDFPRAQDALTAATQAPNLAALRLPLLDAISMTSRSRTALSWWSLADDLNNWSPHIAKAWKTAFFTAATTSDSATPIDEEEK